MELIIVAIFITVVILAILFRNTVVVKRYWKYLIVGLPAIILLIMNAIIKMKNSNNSNSEESLRDEIDKIRDKIIEEETIAAIEITAARTENEVVVKKLEEIKKIPDDRERRKRLADLI